MNRLTRLAATVAVALPLAAAAAVPSAAKPTTDSSPVVVELDRTKVDAGPGEKITFESTVRNTGDQPLSGLIAHLNILTSDPDVYVDPEDWSASRTQYLDELPPGESTRLSWTVQAVTSGPLILYVAVTDPATATVTASGPIDMTVGGQRVVNSGGVLPLVLWMPAGVLALLGTTFVRRRRHR